jgi:hypothetical protein
MTPTLSEHTFESKAVYCARLPAESKGLDRRKNDGAVAAQLEAARLHGQRIACSSRGRGGEIPSGVAEPFGFSEPQRLFRAEFVNQRFRPPHAEGAVVSTSAAQALPYLVVCASATRRKTCRSRTGTASPSRTISMPSFHWLHPVVTAQCGLAARFFDFCSSAPLEK